VAYNYKHERAKECTDDAMSLSWFHAAIILDSESDGIPNLAFKPIMRTRSPTPPIQAVLKRFLKLET
jgi:hypothetical protein